MQSITKHLVWCPNCEVTGHPQPIGEVLEDGNFSILRRTNTTLVVGDHFIIACGACGQSVYKKERRLDEVPSIGVTWIHREEIVFPLGTIGTPSYTPEQGTVGTV